MKSKQKSEPIDLGIKIGTKEEAAWTGIKEKVELDIEIAKREIVINESILIKADDMIEKEKSLNTSKKKE